MEFRSAVLLALWTLLSGPILATPPAPDARSGAARVWKAPATPPAAIGDRRAR